MSLFSSQESLGSNADTPIPDSQGVARDLSDYRLAFKLINQYYNDLSDPEFDPIRKRVFKHLDCLRSSFPDLEKLKGLKVLDIACGSRIFQGNYHHKFDPWMSRLLVYLGAEPLGIDIVDQKNETFGSYVLDLTEIDSLSLIPNCIFDAYYVAAFPTVSAIESFQAKGLTWTELRSNISIHLERILKRDGVEIQGFTPGCNAFVLDVLSRPISRVDDSEY